MAFLEFPAGNRHIRGPTALCALGSGPRIKNSCEAREPFYKLAPQKNGGAFGTGFPSSDNRRAAGHAGKRACLRDTLGAWRVFGLCRSDPATDSNGRRCRLRMSFAGASCQPANHRVGRLVLVRPRPFALLACRNPLSGKRQERQTEGSFRILRRKFAASLVHSGRTRCDTAPNLSQALRLIFLNPAG